MTKQELMIIENNSKVIFGCIERNETTVNTAALKSNLALASKLMEIEQYINSNYYDLGMGVSNNSHVCTIYIWLISESVKNSAAANTAFEDSNVVNYVRNIEAKDHLLLHIITEMRTHGMLD